MTVFSLWLPFQDTHPHTPAKRKAGTKGAPALKPLNVPFFLSEFWVGMEQGQSELHIAIELEPAPFSRIQMGPSQSYVLGRLQRVPWGLSLVRPPRHSHATETRTRSMAGLRAYVATNILTGNLYFWVLLLCPCHGLRPS